MAARYVHRRVPRAARVCVRLAAAGGTAAVLTTAAWALSDVSGYRRLRAVTVSLGATSPDPRKTTSGG